MHTLLRIGYITVAAYLLIGFMLSSYDLPDRLRAHYLHMKCKIAFANTRREKLHIFLIEGLSEPLARWSLPFIIGGVFCAFAWVPLLYFGRKSQEVSEAELAEMEDPEDML